MLGIVAHRLRGDMVIDLALRFPDAIVSIDDRLPSVAGCAENHLSVLKRLATSRDEWNIVIEDDAQPVERFAEQTKDALSQADSPVVGLYLGTSTPTSHAQQVIVPAVREAAATDASWIISSQFFNAVGYAIRRDVLRSMIKHLSANGGPIDYRIDQWLGANRLEAWYTAPSLVDHANEISLIGGAGDPDAHKRAPRRAHVVGVREQWTKVSVRI